jgi:hypothetical protein
MFGWSSFITETDVSDMASRRQLFSGPQQTKMPSFHDSVITDGCDLSADSANKENSKAAG